MKLHRIAVVCLFLIVIWLGHKMRYTDSYEFESATQDTPAGTVVIRLIPASHSRQDGIIGRTIDTGPYKLKIWCEQGSRIDSISNLSVGPANEPNGAVPVTVVAAPYKSAVPTPWYFGLKDPLELKYENTFVAFKIVVQDKSGLRREASLNVTLKTHHLTNWSNDVVSGL